MNDRAHFASDLSSSAPQEHFSDWHPLNSDWLEDLAAEIQDIVRIAQQSLRDNGRSDKDLAAGMTQIRAWQQDHPELTDMRAPELIFDEDLGNHLKLGAFADFLLAPPSGSVLKMYEYAALALLKEARGLAELGVVARKDALSPVAQHLTLKVVQLHTTCVLLRMMDDNPELRDNVRTIMISLLKDQNATV